MSKYINEFPQHQENGEPCANYVAYFGEPNQDPKTFPKAPFADAAYSTALSATQTLNSDGRYVQEIFLDGLYSIQIDRPDGSMYLALTSFEGSSGDAGSVTESYVDTKVAEEISRAQWFHNDSSLNSGTTFSIGAYRVRGYNGAEYEDTGTTNFLMTDDATNMLVFSMDDGMFYEVAADSVESHHVALYLITCLGGSITSITDYRSFFDARNRLPADYLQGLAISVNSSDPDNDIDFAVGEANSSNNKMDMSLGTALTKRLDASWAAGNDAGGLFTGSIAASTTYYAFVISDPDGTVECGFDTDPAAANKPSDYTHYRSLGQFDTDADSKIDSTTLVSESGDPTIQERDAAGFADWFVIEDWTAKSGSSSIEYTGANYPEIAKCSKLRLEFKEFMDGNLSGVEEVFYINMEYDNVGTPTWYANNSQRGVGEYVYPTTSSDWMSLDSKGMHTFPQLREIEEISGWMEICNVNDPDVFTTVEGLVFLDHVSDNDNDAIIRAYGSAGIERADTGFRLRPDSTSGVAAEGTFRLLGQL